MQRREDTLCFALKQMSDKSQRWGLNAIGVDAGLYVSLDERVDETGWRLQLEYNGISLVVGLDSPKEVTLILAFMTENYGKTKFHVTKEGEYPGVPAGRKRYYEVASMKIKTAGEVEARVSKFGDLPDRFHIFVGTKGFGFHADLQDPDTSKLISALKQVAEEMTGG
jgi:hypothetical protein